MKDFLGEIIVFLLPVLLLMTGLEGYNRVRKGNEIIAKKSLLADTTLGTQLVILGNSHGKDGIDPREFTTPAVNACMSGMPLSYSQFVLENLLPNTCEQVILNVSYQDLYRKENAPEWTNKRYELYHYLGASQALKNQRLDWRNYSVLASIGFRKGWKNMLMDLHGSQRQKDLYERKGQTPRNEQMNQARSTELSKIRIALHHDLMDVSEFDRQIIVLEQIVAYCKSNNIRITLLTLPVSASYLVQQIEPYVNFRSILDEFAEERQINYFDFTRMSEFQVDHFSDPDHLNEKGSELLMQKMKDTLLSL